MTRKSATSSRPEAALITNHGYAGPELPIGGAPDTGGQNVYVHNQALALEELGYTVTIFARGGFPHFRKKEIRQGTEPFSKHVRYVYVPGGGDTFIRKEDIAVALDEELDWLEGFIRKEAGQRECKPWEVYEFINTHYWDAAVLGAGLSDRWKNDVCAKGVEEFLSGVVDKRLFETLWNQRRWTAVGNALPYYLGRILIEGTSSPSMVPKNRTKMAANRWAQAKRKKSAPLVTQVQKTMASASRTMAPAMLPFVAAEALGQALLDARPKKTKGLLRKLKDANRHVWTPHSLGPIKETGFRFRPLEEKRDLKFCERRGHERAVCVSTRAFVATSEAIARSLRCHFGVTQDRMFYFPPCVDRRIFRPYTKGREPAYKYLAEYSGVSVETLTAGRIVFETSRMDTSKRKDLLLAAFEQIVDEVPDAYLFIGGGPRTEVYESLVKLRDSKPRLKGRAFLLGFVPDEYMGPLFSLAKLYVSASEMEGFGMSVAQAAAARTALVCSDRIPFARQYVPQDAIVLKADDVKGFAKAMRKLLLDDKDRIARAYRLAEKVRPLDWRIQTAEFLNHLKRRGFGLTRTKPSARSNP